MTDHSTKNLSGRIWAGIKLRAGWGQKIAAAFLVVLLFAIANVLVVTNVVVNLHDVASAVDVSGRLRMLSQKLAAQGLGLLQGVPSSAPAIHQDVFTFDRYLQVLQYGGIAAGHELAGLSSVHGIEFSQMHLAWEQYKSDLLNATEAAAQSESAANTQIIDPLAQAEKISRGAGNVLLQGQALTEAIVAQAELMHMQALGRMYLLLGADFIFLLALFLLARKQLIQPLRELTDHCQELALGNYDTRVSYRSSDEIGRLAVSFNRSAQQIGQLVSELESDRAHLRETEAMFFGLAANSIMGVYIVQGQSFRYVNPQMASMLGYDSAQALMQVDTMQMFPEEDRAHIQESIDHRLTGKGTRSHFERRVVRADQSIILVEFYSSVVTLDGVDTIMGMALDITPRKEAEATARLAALVYENSSEAMVITDRYAEIVSVNPAFTTITGYASEEVVGQKISVLSSGRQDKAFYQAMWRSIVSTGKWQGDIWNRRKHGEEYAERLSVDTAYNPDGSVQFRIGLFSDITKKKQSDALIWRQANYDHLTGLPNRQLFHDRLEQSIARSRRSKLPMALVFLDLDLFKQVNDTLGHDKGDELLKQVAKRLSRTLRATDTVARLGGDEFIMIIGELKDAHVVERLCQETLDALAQPYILGKDSANVSASLGVTYYPQDATDAQNLLKNADLAMYAAKEKGRNQYAIFAQSMRKTAQTKRQLSRDLRDALEQDQFSLHYQPIVSLGTGKVRNAEALIRWQHPVSGLTGPSDFIPFAEDSGIIVGIGDWVFRQAAKQLASWRQQYHPEFSISINVSCAQFLLEGLDLEVWLDYLNVLGLPGDSMMVEVSERLLLSMDRRVAEKLQALHEAGVQIALGGIGHASLSYLKSFPVDLLKIEQSLVRNVTSDNDDHALCVNIIQMSHKLGLQVVAEGMETLGQQSLLAKAGCDYGQGYVFARPMSAEKFAAYLDGCYKPTAVAASPKPVSL